MKNRLISSLFFIFLLTCILHPQAYSAEQNLNDVILRIQNSIAQKDVTAYLENFSEEIKAAEESSFNDKFKLFGMEKAVLFKIGETVLSESEAEVYVQALFQNSYSVIIETWHLNLLKVDEIWQVREKNIAGNITSLYLVQIPSNRVERVESVEIEHKDIQLSFKNALLFYDNIPELETALVIIGKGNVHFSPSNSVERHLLKLSYKKDFLEDELTYAYLRFSNQFFRNNIKIVRNSSSVDFQPTQAERSEAHSIFSRHYSRSFTVENSLNK